MRSEHMTTSQQEILDEVIKYRKIVCLHAIDQPLTNAFVAIVLEQQERITYLERELKVCEHMSIKDNTI